MIDLFMSFTLPFYHYLAWTVILTQTQGENRRRVIDRLDWVNPPKKDASHKSKLVQAAPPGRPTAVRRCSTNIITGLLLVQSLGRRPLCRVNRCLHSPSSLIKHFLSTASARFRQNPNHGGTSAPSPPWHPLMLVCGISLFRCSIRLLVLSGLLDRPHGLPSPPVLLLCVLLLWNSRSCRWLAVTQQSPDLVVHGTNGRSITKPHQPVQKA
jgi:hypothetical protein